MVKPTTKYDYYTINYPTIIDANVNSKLNTINVGDITSGSTANAGITPLFSANSTFYKDGVYSFVVKVFNATTGAYIDGRYIAGTFLINRQTGLGVQAVNQTISSGADLTTSVFGNDVGITNTSGATLRFQITFAPLAVGDNVY